MDDLEAQLSAAFKRAANETRPDDEEDEENEDWETGSDDVGVYDGNGLEDDKEYMDALGKIPSDLVRRLRGQYHMYRAMGIRPGQYVAAAKTYVPTFREAIIVAALGEVRLGSMLRLTREWAANSETTPRTFSEFRAAIQRVIDEDKGKTQEGDAARSFAERIERSLNQRYWGDDNHPKAEARRADYIILSRPFGTSEAGDKFPLPKANESAKSYAARVSSVRKGHRPPPIGVADPNAPQPEQGESVQAYYHRYNRYLTYQGDETVSERRVRRNQERTLRCTANVQGHRCRARALGTRMVDGQAHHVCGMHIRSKYFEPYEEEHGTQERV